MALTTQDRLLIEQRIANEAKSTGVAYALWYFTGVFGGHRFYLGRPGSAIAQLCLTILGLMSIGGPIGFILLAILAIWIVIDAFMIPGMIQEHKDGLRERLSSEAAHETRGLY